MPVVGHWFAIGLPFHTAIATKPERDVTQQPFSIGRLEYVDSMCTWNTSDATKHDLRNSGFEIAALLQTKKEVAAALVETVSLSDLKIALRGGRGRGDMTAPPRRGGGVGEMDAPAP